MEDETLKREAYPQERPPEHDGYYLLPDGERIGRCRSCNAQIVWVLTDSGARMPLDLKHTRVNLEGQLEVLTHFATCPHGKAWSKRGKGR
jgi:hypothetical protein